MQGRKSHSADSKSSCLRFFSRVNLRQLQNGIGIRRSISRRDGFPHRPARGVPALGAAEGFLAIAAAYRKVRKNGFHFQISLAAKTNREMKSTSSHISTRCSWSTYDPMMFSFMIQSRWVSDTPGRPYRAAIHIFSKSTCIRKWYGRVLRVMMVVSSGSYIKWIPVFTWSDSSL